MTTVRCAIYTRKSSEEGLEQGFNSLDAQREACAAYVLSQASEGWTLVPEPYDDGGLSGGTLERPALQRLLAEVAAGRIDIIVVYKVDRLTRSLLDFSRLVEAFDAGSVSFVSITQSFNTTTSMGRLTLNMLLSFAQFEREVTAERIRDKIAASKAKGMWMGGTPPLGYHPDGRTLAIVEEHAGLVRMLYDRYLALGTVRRLADALTAERICTPLRTSGTGKSFGGCAFSRGQLYAILKNPIYVGDIAHRGTIHRGQHPPIIDRDAWVRVQQALADNLQGERQTTVADASLLAGRVFDEQGEPMVAVHASKVRSATSGHRVRYRYYVSRSLQHKTAANEGQRVPAREIEQLVAHELAALFDDPLGLAAQAAIALRPERLAAMTQHCQQIAADLRTHNPRHLSALLTRVELRRGSIAINLDPSALASLLDLPLLAEAPPSIPLVRPAELGRAGRAVRLIRADGVREGQPDPTLVKLIVHARTWWTALAEGHLNVDALARRERVSPSYVTRVVRLAFLAPPIIEAILDGRQDPRLDGTTLLATGSVPPLWVEQRQRYLPHP